MEFTLKTERLLIQPFRDSFLEAYYTEFTDEIVKYQYPDSFPDMNTANETVSMFVKDMERGNMLELVILTQDGEFFRKHGSLRHYRKNARAWSMAEKLSARKRVWLRSSEGFG